MHRGRVQGYGELVMTPSSGYSIYLPRPWSQRAGLSGSRILQRSIVNIQFLLDGESLHTPELTLDKEPVVVSTMERDSGREKKDM